MSKVKIGNVFPPLAWLMERCAPAGFGLGGKSALLTAKDNLNNIKANGWYYWHSDSVPANVPTMNHTSYMICMRVWTTDGGVCCQELMDMTDSVARGTKIQRTAYVDTFYDWEWVNPPMFSGIEYRTTERWNGKPVYTALVDCGACVSPSKETTTELTCRQIIRHCGTVSGHSMPAINATMDNAWSAWAMVTNSDGRVKITVYCGTGMATERAYVQVWYTKE